MKEEKRKQIILKLPAELKDNFYEFCKTKGYCPSKRIRVLMEEDCKTLN